MMRAAQWMGLGLMACSGGDKVDETPTGETGTDPQACANAVEATLPLDGATDVYYRTSVRMTLDDEDPSAVITLADAAGEDVAGASTVEGKTVIFRPTDPLDFQATYTATLAYECKEGATLEFTTSSVGMPVSVDPVGRVYDLDLVTGTWTRPAGVGDLIVAAITEDISVFLMPSSIDEKGNVIDFIGAAPSPTDPDAQDLCSDPFFVTGATWSDPHFEGATDALAISVLGIAVTIQNLEISGDIADDGSSIEIERFAGEIDARQIAAIDLCSVAPDGCQACSFEPTAKTCLEAEVENLSLPYLPAVAPLVAEPVCPN